MAPPVTPVAAAAEGPLRFRRRVGACRRAIRVLADFPRWHRPRRFLAVSDRGAVVRFDPRRRGARGPGARSSDGPGRLERNGARDAESLLAIDGGRGWWIGYEQRHSLWLYDRWLPPGAGCRPRPGRWRDNRGPRAALDAQGDAGGPGKMATRHARIGCHRTVVVNAPRRSRGCRPCPGRQCLAAAAQKVIGGISQSVAPMFGTAAGYRAGPAWPLPRAPSTIMRGWRSNRSPTVAAGAFGW